MAATMLIKRVRQRRVREGLTTTDVAIDMRK